MSRSTAPAAGWPWTVAPRNRYADEDATAPAATTPLMKVRREADCGMSSDIILSSIAGSPRRAGGPTGRRGIYPTHDIPYRFQVQTIFASERVSDLVSDTLQNLPPGAAFGSPERRAAKC